MKKTIILLVSFLLISAHSVFAFSDLESSHPNYEAIQYLEEIGMLQGYEDGTIKADQTVNRAELLKLVLEKRYRYFDYLDLSDKKNCFTDVQEQWFAKYVCFAKDMQLINGYDDGSFKPEQEVVFAEAAKIINNTLYERTGGGGYSHWYDAFVMILSQEAIIPLSITSVDQELTRGKVAEMIWRSQYYWPKKDFRVFNIFEENELRVGLKESRYLSKKDSKLYYYGTEVEDLDANSFEFIGESNYYDPYFRDSENIFYAMSPGYVPKVENADIDTFEALNEFYAKDKNYIYLDDRSQEVADIDTFEIVDGVFSKDSQNVYMAVNKYEGSYYTPIEGADPETFELAGYLYTKDSNNVYYLAGMVEGADVSTFKVLGDYGYASDAGHIYCNGMVLPEADPEFFEVLGESYAQDDSYVYNGCEVLEWPDRETFRFIDLPFQGYLIDKDNVYYGPDYVEGAHPDLFEIVKEHYAKDDQNIYYGSIVAEEADYDTFTELEDGFAYDKNTLFHKGYNLSATYSLIN